MIPNQEIPKIAKLFPGGDYQETNERKRVTCLENSISNFSKLVLESLDHMSIMFLMNFCDLWSGNREIIPFPV